MSSQVKDPILPNSMHFICRRGGWREESPQKKQVTGLLQWFSSPVDPASLSLFGSCCFEAYLLLGTTTTATHAPLWCLFNQFTSDVAVRTDANAHPVFPPLQMCWWLDFPGVQITFPQTKPGERENHKVETCAAFGLIKTACFISTLLSLFTSSTLPLPLTYLPLRSVPSVLSLCSRSQCYSLDSMGCCKYLIEAKALPFLRPYTLYLHHLSASLVHFSQPGVRETERKYPADVCYLRCQALSLNAIVSVSLNSRS